MTSAKTKNLLFILCASLLVSAVWGSAVPGSWSRLPRNISSLLSDGLNSPQDTPKNKLPYPLKDRKVYEKKKKNPIDLQDPPNVDEDISLDEDGKTFNVQPKVGNEKFGLPASQDFKEFLKEEQKRNQRDYFQQRAKAQNFVKGGGIIPTLNVGPKIFDKIFGSGVIDIRPQGTAELIFSGNFNTVRNPAFTARQQKTGQFDFKQKIQLNVQGSIGDKLKVSMNYDTEATFDFENQTKLDYSGKEDEIIKKIELGNVSLPLNSSLIQGSQSLFGIKTQMQFGRMTVTSIFTQQKGKITETEVSGGAQTTKFDIQGDNYEANKHFFLSQYFRSNYDFWMKDLPVISSPVIITRVEVWVTNKNGAYEGVRDVLGLQDLGEYSTFNTAPEVNNPSGDQLPSNKSNNLINIFQQEPKLRNSFEVIQTLQDQNLVYKNYLQNIRDYQLLNYARQLSASEFTLNSRLGYISLNTALNSDEMLCVAFEYTYNGRPYKVGEFTADVPTNIEKPNVLFLKMLKGQNIRPDYPMWDLMMKNIYSLGAYQIQPKDFRLNLIYADDPSGADLNYIPAAGEPALQGVPLLSVLNLDRINVQQEPTPDGNFDYLEGYTVVSSNGRIIFPVVEPFGSYLRTKFIDQTKANYYVFQELYDSTRFAALQVPQKNKFFLRGSYQSAAGSEIPLGAINVPKGSVKVTANGTLLTENVDYTVDYSAGRVRIINSGLLASGAVIKVSSESNTLFNIQQKTLMGARFDYKVSNNFLLGSTIMYLRERPLTPKVNIGEEPLANLIVGLDGSYNRESRFLTKLVDKLPFIQTKEISTIQISGEYARLIPGVQKTIGKKGNAYIDDFEGSETPIDLKGQNSWVLSSVPQGQPDLFGPESQAGNNNLAMGYRRARLSWYSVDPTFYLDQATTPAQIKGNLTELSNHNVRQVRLKEVFPQRQIQQGMPDAIQTFDLSFYPYKRGPYNYTINGLNSDGSLKNAQDNWGGIMRRLETNDFEAANIDYVEIWVMDPFAENKKLGIKNPGELYINLGNVSEDVLKDGRKSFENGLPKNGATNFDTSAWGRIPRYINVNSAFENDANARKQQDVGLDGLSSVDEQIFFKKYLDSVRTVFGPAAPVSIEVNGDPSADDYAHYFEGSSSSILERYQRVNNHEGNSTTDKIGSSGTAKAATNLPDDEDLNRDFTINDLEEYYQYKIDVSENGLQVGQNYVAASVTSSVKLPNDKVETITWYQLKIPIRDYQRKVGEINDFKSIRFMRMFMRGFSDSVTLRFAQLQLVRADWRKYLNSLVKPGDFIPTDPNDPTEFVVSTVNIEENSGRIPVIYTLPPGIAREQDVSNPRPVQMNEQSLSLRVCNLKDGDARSVFKTTFFDIRNYKKLRMFLHAEGENLQNGELTAFIRLGTDLTNNYYEYEIPLVPTPFGSTSPDIIWPGANELVADVEDFYRAKQARYSSGGAQSTPFSIMIGDRKVTVLGLPDLSNVRVIMLGVRNPKRGAGNLLDDGLPKCGEIWFNELRVSDFINRSGWATTGRVVTKLADFGTLQASGNYKSVGWGGIDKKLNERSLKDELQLSFSSNFELGKFFPAKSGISIPFFYSYSQTSVKPLYNPLNPDIQLKTALEASSPAEQDRIKRASEDFSTQRSINFTNVRKNRVGGKRAHLYDIENFNVSYSYTESYRRNENIEYSILKNYQAGLGYNHSFQNKPVTPFKRVKGKNAAVIRDFNFNYLPASWSARYTFDRRFGETIYRNNDNTSTVLLPLYDKNFTMTRFYEMRWDLTRSLKLDYSATVNARIDEPRGKIDNPEKKDSVKTNLLRLGRTTSFSQNVALNYTVPINKIPAFNWVTLTTRYSAGYNWLTAPPAADSLGNSISNKQDKSLNGQFNMVTLYNKSKFLQKINNPQLAKKDKKEEENDQEDGKGSGKKKKFVLKKNFKTGKKDTVWIKEKKKKEFDAGPAFRALVRAVMSVRNVSFSFSENNSVFMPGFKPKPSYLGQNYDVNAPGFDFIFGSQDPNFRYRAAENGWLVRDTRVTQSFSMTKSRNFTARALLEPMSDLRIDVNVNRTISFTNTSNFRFDTTGGANKFQDLAPLESGNFSMSFFSLRTAFQDPDKLFEKMAGSRYTIARRLQAENPGNSVGFDPVTGFPKGYGKLQQEVLMYSFLSAYTGKSPDRYKLKLFPTVPQLNWSVNYNGLSKVELFKDYVSNVALTHRYTSTYTIADFRTSVFNDSAANNGDIINPKYIVKQISINERFAPLLGVDMTFVNNVTASFNYNTSRQLGFSLGNPQLTEQRSKEYVIGIGYRTKELKIPVGRGKKMILENDLTFRLDFSIRDDKTIVKKLDAPVNEPVSGNRIISIKPTIDYMINEKLNIRIFYDRRVTKPAASNSFPTAITSGGFSIRYTIQ